MRCVIQRVSKAHVEVNQKQIGSINRGLLLLLGVGNNDTIEDLNWLTNKIAQLRIFSDTEGKMNLSIQDIEGEILVISQFTLFAKTKKGNRPSFIDSGSPEIAEQLYLKFCEALKTFPSIKHVATGKFGANMQVNLVNDGPVTIVIDTKNKE